MTCPNGAGPTPDIAARDAANGRLEAGAEGDEGARLDLPPVDLAALRALPERPSCARLRLRSPRQAGDQLDAVRTPIALRYRR